MNRQTETDRRKERIQLISHKLGQQEAIPFNKIYNKDGLLQGLVFKPRVVTVPISFNILSMSNSQKNSDRKFYSYAAVLFLGGDHQGLKDG